MNRRLACTVAIIALLLPEICSSPVELVSELKRTAEVVVPADPSAAQINKKCSNEAPTAPGRSRLLTVVFGAFGRLDKGNPKKLDVAHVRSILLSVEHTGLLDQKFASQIEFHVAVSCGETWGKINPRNIDCTSFAEQATAQVHHLPNVQVHIFHGNAFEYPAMHWMWQLACSSPDRVYLYFHSKGTRYPIRARKPTRIPFEMVLFNEVVAPWRNYLGLFAQRPDLDTAGAAVANAGFLWHNFYYINGQFASRLAEPNISAGSRWYYEKRWLREMPKDPKTSACRVSAPVFGQPVAKGIEIVYLQKAKSNAFQVLSCGSGSIDRTVNKEYFPPLVHAMKERLKDFKARNLGPDLSLAETLE